MATATSKKCTSFNVLCPYCRDQDATVSLDLNDMTECRCQGCDETFSPARARDLAAAELRRWEAILRWIDLAGSAMAPAE